MITKADFYVPKVYKFIDEEGTKHVKFKGLGKSIGYDDLKAGTHKKMMWFKKLINGIRIEESTRDFTLKLNKRIKIDKEGREMKHEE